VLSLSAVAPAPVAKHAKKKKLNVPQGLTEGALAPHAHITSHSVGARAGIYVGGRLLNVTRAVDRNEAKTLEANNLKVKEDKRHLYLAKEGGEFVPPYLRAAVRDHMG
jgi:hypothetical protein